MKTIKSSDKAKAAFEFRRSLTPETDRGCALMAAAYLEDQLAELLTFYFTDDGKVVKELFEPAGPLGTLSSRIDIAYALGLIGPNARRELHLIRKVRNDFGHEPRPISFDHAPIASRCRELHQHQLLPGGSPRASFTRSVMGLLARIHGELRRTQHRDIGRDLLITDSDKKKFQHRAAELWEDLENIGKQDLSSEEMQALAQALENDMVDWLKDFDDK